MRYNISQDLDKDVRLGLEKFYAARDARVAYYDRRWIKNYALAENYRNKNRYPYRSSVVIPTIFADIHDQLPKFIEAAFGGRPTINANPLNDLAIANTKNVEDVETWDFQRAKIRQKTYSWVQQFLVFGTGIVKPMYRFDSRRDEIVYDGPDLANMDINTFYPSPEATCDHPPLYWVHRKIFPNMKALEREAKLLGYKRLKDIKQLGVSDEDFRLDILTYINLGYSDAESLREAVEVLELHDEHDRTVMAIANRQVLIKEPSDEPFDFPQYAIVRNYQSPYQFWGKGEPEVLEGMYHALNTKINQSIDNAEIYNNQAVVTEEGAMADESQNILRPGTKIWMKKDKIDKIKPAPFRDINLHGNLEEQRYIQVLMRMAAVGEHSLSGPNQRKTATEVQEQANKEVGRIGQKIQMFEYFGLKAVAEIFLDMRRKLSGMGIPIVKEDERTGEKYPWVITEKDLAGEFDLEPMGSRVAATRDKEREEAQAMLDTGKGVPFIDQKELYRRYFQKLGIKDVPGLFLKEQPQLGQPQGMPSLPSPEMAGVQ